MSEVRLVSPLLDNFSLGHSISDHNGVRCFPAMRNDSDERFIVKTISIPASQVQLEALLLTGAYPNAEAAKDYFRNLAKGIRSEIQVLDKLAAQRGFLPYLNHQIVPMKDAVGYEIYLLSPYKMTLERHLRQAPLTHLSAVNMGIDLCAALVICRENGYLYVDLKPENIILSGNQTYHIADLGFIALNALKFSSLPERYRSAYTAPEIVDAFSTLNTTMDTYALGLVLYQVFNNGELPRPGMPGEPIPAPVYADREMTEIILRAIDPDPIRRWADPVDMGKALILYMQRNTVNDDPIGPPAVEEEPVPAEVPEEAVPEAEAAPAEEAAELPVEEPVEMPEEAAEAVPAESAVHHPTGITDAAVIEATIRAAIAADRAAEQAASGMEAAVAEEPTEAVEEAEESAEPAEETEESTEAVEETEESAEPAEETEESAEPAEETEESAEPAEETEESAEPAEEAEESAEPAEETEESAEPAEETEESAEPAEEAEESAEPAEETEESAEPTEESEESAEPAEESEESTEAAEETEESAEPADETEESAEPVEEAEESAEPTEETEESAEQPENDWIDVLHEILPEEETSNPDEPSLRDLLSDKADAPSAQEADETAVLSDDTAKILTQAQELIEHETPDPVVAPEPIEIPMPEPIVLKEEPPAEPEQTEEAAPAEEEAPKVFRKITFTEEPDSRQEQPEAEALPDAEPPKKRFAGLGKKLAKLCVGIAVLAGLAVGARYYYMEYYLQEVSDFRFELESGAIVVHVETEADPSLITVVLKDTYGNAETAPLVDGQASFSELKPASQYTISLSIDGFHQLSGADPLTYSTPSLTQILNLTAVTGAENGSVILNFAVEGPDSEEWTLTYSSANTEEQSMTFTGHTVTVPGLTIGETYTFSLSCDSNTYLTGENSIEYSVSDVILAENLSVAGYADSSMTVRWDIPEGLNVPTWTAHCYNEEGYDQVVQVSGNSAVFENISLDSAYTVEVTAQGMTQCARLAVTASPITVTNFTAAVNGADIDLSWEATGTIPENGWEILVSVDGSTEQMRFQTTETSFTVSPAAPGSHYEFTLQTPDATSVFGGSAAVDMPGGSERFLGYGLSADTIHPFTYRVPNLSSWDQNNLTLADATDTFRPGDDLALLFYTGNAYESSGDSVTTVMVFRDANGNLAGIDSDTRIWSDMWNAGYCVYQVSNLPVTPGDYTLELYLNGSALDSLEITISE